MTYFSRFLASPIRSCFSILLLTALLILTGCDSGVAVDPLPAAPAAIVAADPVASAAQAKMLTRTVTGDVIIEGAIRAVRGNRARGLVRATGTTADGTPFDLDGRAQYIEANTDGVDHLFERAQLRLVGTVGTVAFNDSIMVRLRYREDDAEGTVYDVRSQYRTDEQQGRLRGTLTGLFSGDLKSDFQFAGEFEFQVASRPAR